MIGPHIIGSISAHYDRLRRWQPRLILVLDPSPDQVRELRQICPKSFIVGRVYRPDQEVEQRIRANPQEAARWAHNAIMERFTPEVNAWQLENEVLQQWDGLPLLNQFALERMRLADEQGYKAAILAFSVGNPDLPQNDRMALWRQVYPSLAYADQHDHVVVVHQYGAPHLRDPDANWYIHRLEHQVLPQLPFSRVKFACTEFGIDNRINHQESGWRGSTDAQSYTADLINIGQYLERYQDRVHGYAVFTLGNTNPWQSYDIDGEVAEQLANYYLAHPQPSFAAAPTVISMPVQPVVAPAFQPGDIVQTADFCRLRGQPGLNGETLGVFAPNFAAYVASGPQIVDNLVWWNVTGVTSDGKLTSGWTAQQNQTGIVLLHKPEGVLSNRLQAPFDGRYPLTQWFGEHPEDYVDFGLRGHNGIDLALPQGIPVKAVDDGWAFQVQDDPQGFGHFVKLRHAWGESICAHLSQFALQQGQQVAKGQVIGYSGSTGNSTGPHLHLSIRVDPYDLKDGWLGYSDPLPWLPKTCYSLTDEQVKPLPEPQPSEPTPVPPLPAPGPQPATPTVARHLAAAYGAMHLTIQNSAPLDNVDVVYVVKDVFTTQDGKWDVGQTPPPYGIEQWARDAYLKPLGAPDYFDDAGAATHLFGAVVGLDGQLIRHHPMHWWNQDKTIHYDTPTKDKSGWANMFMNGDSAFWPDQGQTGTWSWAPEGAIEQIAGGGLPNKWHVATFVVWQAVKRN